MAPPYLHPKADEMRSAILKHFTPAEKDAPWVWIAVTVDNLKYLYRLQEGYWKLHDSQIKAELKHEDNEIHGICERLFYWYVQSENVGNVISWEDTRKAIEDAKNVTGQERYTAAHVMNAHKTWSISLPQESKKRETLSPEHDSTPRKRPREQKSGVPERHVSCPARPPSRALNDLSIVRVDSTIGYGISGNRASAPTERNVDFVAHDSVDSSSLNTVPSTRRVISGSFRVSVEDPATMNIEDENDVPNEDDEEEEIEVINASYDDRNNNEDHRETSGPSRGLEFIDVPEDDLEENHDLYCSPRSLREIRSISVSGDDTDRDVVKPAAFDLLHNHKDQNTSKSPRASEVQRLGDKISDEEQFKSSIVNELCSTTPLSKESFDYLLRGILPQESIQIFCAKNVQAACGVTEWLETIKSQASEMRSLIITVFYEGRLVLFVFDFKRSRKFILDSFKGNTCEDDSRTDLMDWLECIPVGGQFQADEIWPFHTTNDSELLQSTAPWDRETQMLVYCLHLALVEEPTVHNIDTFLWRTIIASVISKENQSKEWIDRVQRDAVLKVEDGEVTPLKKYFPGLQGARQSINSARHLKSRIEKALAEDLPRMGDIIGGLIRCANDWHQKVSLSIANAEGRAAAHKKACDQYQELPQNHPDHSDAIARHMNDIYTSMEKLQVEYQSTVQLKRELLLMVQDVEVFQKQIGAFVKVFEVQLEAEKEETTKVIKEHEVAMFDLGQDESHKVADKIAEMEQQLAEMKKAQDEYKKQYESEGIVA